MKISKRITNIDEDINYLETKLRVLRRGKYTLKSVKSSHRLVKQIDLLKKCKLIYNIYERKENN